MKIQCFKIHIISSVGLRVHYVVGKEIILGRADDCDVQIQSPKTSRRHLKVWSENSEIYIEDLGSSKGTTVNGKPIKANRGTRYKVGETIQIGGLYGFVTITLIPEAEQVLLAQAKDKDFDNKTVATGLSQHFSSWLKDKMARPTEDGVSEEERELLSQRLVQEAQANAKMEQMFNQARAAVKRLEAEATDELSRSVTESKKMIDQYRGEAEAKMQVEVEALRAERNDTLAREMSELKISYIAEAEKAAANIKQVATEEQLRMRDAMAEKARKLYEDVTLKANENAKMESEELLRKAKLDAEVETKRAREQVEQFEQQKERLNNDIRSTEAAFESIKANKDKLTREIEEKGRKIIEAARAESAEESARTKESLNREIKTYKDQIENLKNEKENSIRGHAEAEAQARESTKDLERIKIQLDVLKSEYVKLNADKEVEYEGWARKILSAQRECDSLSKDFSEMKSEKEAIARELEKLIQAREHEIASAGKLREQAEKELSEAKLFSEKSMSAAKNEAQQLKTAAEKEIALTKVREMERIKEASARDESGIQKLRSAQSKELERLLNQQLLTHIAGQPEAGNKNVTQLSKDISRIVRMVMDNENVDVQDHMKKYESYDPVSALKSRKYLQRSAVGAIAFIVIIVLAKSYWPDIRESARALIAEKNQAPSAQQVYAKELRQKQEERARFEPKLTKDYKDSYTKNVIYTLDFVQTTLSEPYQKEWILKLNDFFENQLKISENAIVPFAAKETNLIKGLNEIRGTIHPDYLDDALNKMHELEAYATSDMIDTVGGARNWKKFLKFKKGFYEGFDPSRLPTSE